MSILNIRPAVRAGSKLVLGIAGQSGSGKTLTALYIARGMVDNASEIGFLDTENRRGSLYADELDAPFMIGDLFYPFSPDRYATAIKEFQASGVKVLIVDSISHEWESGCMEIAEAPLLRGKKMADWKKAKSEHKKFMTVLLQSDMHIICCIRAAEKMNFTNPSKPESIGVQPLCEKNFLFEMTASIMMYSEGQQQQHLKIPKDLKGVFGDGNLYLGEETGKAIIDWVNSGECDPEMDSYQNKMQLASNDGCDALKSAWLSMPKAMQDKMLKLKGPLWASAQAVDELEKEVLLIDDELPSKPFNPAATVEKTKKEVIEQPAITDEQIQNKF
tara:strand:+ start:1448 stop:2440 length:993 start_codon:yes stop_codon:yes gene_type:complete